MLLKSLKLRDRQQRRIWPLEYQQWADWKNIKLFPVHIQYSTLLMLLRIYCHWKFTSIASRTRAHNSESCFHEIPLFFCHVSLSSCYICKKLLQHYIMQDCYHAFHRQCFTNICQLYIIKDLHMRTKCNFPHKFDAIRSHLSEYIIFPV